MILSPINLLLLLSIILSNLTEKNFKNFEFFYADGYNNLSKKTTHNCCSLFGKWEKTKNSLYEEKHNFDLLLKQQNEKKPRNRIS